MTAEKPMPPAQAIRAMFAHKRVMVVDDEPFSRAIVAEALTAAGFASVGTAASLATAERDLVAAIDPYAAAIVDFELTGGESGLRLLQKIRSGAAGLPRNFPVILISGHAVPALVSRAIALDVCAFLPKPVAQATLCERLYRALSHELLAQPIDYYENISVEDVRPDMPKYFRTGVGTHLLLPPKVGMMLVEISNLHPGQTLARPVTDPTGETLLPAGQVLTRRLLDCLEDLISFEPAYGRVWVKD